MAIEDYITLREALALTGHTDTAQIRRAAQRWADGDHKTGLRAVRPNDHYWLTKEVWVRQWLKSHRRKRGWPPGKPRGPRKQPAGEEPAPS